MAQLTRNGRSARTRPPIPGSRVGVLDALRVSPGAGAPGNTPRRRRPPLCSALARAPAGPACSGGRQHVSKTYPPAFGAGEGETGATTRGLRVTPRTSAPGSGALGGGALEARAPRTLRGGGVLRLRLPLEERALSASPPARRARTSRSSVPPGRRGTTKAAGVPAQTQIQAAQHLGTRAGAGGCRRCRAKPPSGKSARRSAGAFRGERARRCLGGRTRRFRFRRSSR